MKLDAFTKTYGGRRVLDMPAWELADGQITAVIGANGSGKSTLAKVLAGIEPSDRGKPVLPRCAVGYLPQKYCAFRMSVLHNLLLNGGDHARAAQLMEALQLTPLSRASAKKLSGGEGAKMALCRLLMGHYELLILDEPTAAMDMESTLAAEELIRACAKETGCTVLLITHSIQQARRLADRILFLDRGVPVEEGGTAELLTAPKHEKTKRFLEFYGLI